MTTLFLNLCIVFDSVWLYVSCLILALVAAKIIAFTFEIFVQTIFQLLVVFCVFVTDGNQQFPPFAGAKLGI